MAVISFNFTKVIAEQSKPVTGKIKIGNNVKIDSAESADINFGGSSKAGIRFGFEYKSTYQPEIGGITLKGNLIYLQDTDKVKKVLDTWKKDKKVVPEVAKEVLGAVLNRCNIQALILSRDVGLPSPIPLPKVSEQPPKK